MIFNKPKKTIVITGTGIRSPLGNDSDSFFGSILADNSNFSPINFLNLNDETKAGFFKSRCPCSDTHQSHPVVTLPFTILLEATLDALQEGGISLHEIEDDTMALIGTTSGGTRNKELLRDLFIDRDSEPVKEMYGYQNWQSVASHLANKLGLKQGNRTIATACSSGIQAIIYGCMLIQNDVVARVIVGGVNTIDYTSLIGFRSIGVYAKDQIRPFDKTRDGFYIGEGAAVLILEDMDHAKARQAPISAIISGFSSSGDCNSNLTSPAAAGYSICMRKAMESSGLDDTAIDYINAHGTGTKANDAAEAYAIKKCFKNFNTIPVSSTKSTTGHTLGAAGAIESLICLKAIKEKTIPPNKNLYEPDEACRGMSLPRRPVMAEIKNVICNSFGFGGNNTSLILSRFRE